MTYLWLKLPFGGKLDNTLTVPFGSNIIRDDFDGSKPLK
jgi:hypothetical protein